MDFAYQACGCSYSHAYAEFLVRRDTASSQARNQTRFASPILARSPGDGEDIVAKGTLAVIALPKLGQFQISARDEADMGSAPPNIITLEFDRCVQSDTLICIVAGFYCGSFFLRTPPFAHPPGKFEP